MLFKNETRTNPSVQAQDKYITEIFDSTFAKLTAMLLNPFYDMAFDKEMVPSVEPECDDQSDASSSSCSSKGSEEPRETVPKKTQFNTTKNNEVCIKAMTAAVDIKVANTEAVMRDNLF